MHLAYVDESGSTGAGSSLSFTLGCVLVDATRWPDVFDQLLEYRRFLKVTYKIPVRAEIKANYLLRNGGPFRSLKLSEGARFRVYRGFMRLQQKLELSVFAIVVRKDRMDAKRINLDPRNVAWDYLIQRLERFTTMGGTRVWLSHDEGESLLIRRLTRKARRAGTAGSAFGTGSLKRPCRLILDDPVSRNSQESYFIQLADLDAYAAFRKLYAPPPRPVQIVPQDMWDQLGSAAVEKVNYLSGGPTGIVVWP